MGERRKTEISIPEQPTHHKSNVDQKLSTPFFGVFFDEEEEKPDLRDPANRKRFALIVYIIISVQLVITVVCTVPFVIVQEAKTIVFENSWLIFVFLVILIVPYFMLVCCDSTRREFPTNVVLLLFLTIGMAGTCACCSAWFETVAVLYTFILIIIVTVVITALASVSSHSFNSWKWILITMLVFLVVFVIAAIVISLGTGRPLKTFLYPGIVIGLFSAFLLYDTNEIMSGHRYVKIGPSDYILGAAQVYVDVVGIFITFLEVVGTITEND